MKNFSSPLFPLGGTQHLGVKLLYSFFDKEMEKETLLIRERKGYINVCESASGYTNVVLVWKKGGNDGWVEFPSSSFYRHSEEGKRKRKKPSPFSATPQLLIVFFPLPILSPAGSEKRKVFPSPLLIREKKEGVRKSAQILFFRHRHFFALFPSPPPPWAKQTKIAPFSLTLNEEEKSLWYTQFFWTLVY